MQAKYLIIGVNAAGFYAAETLRKYDPHGSIIAINGEPYGPYKRTKINKKFWPPNLDIDSFQLAESSWYISNRITLINNTRVISVNTSSKNAILSTGEVIRWDRLLLSTGADSYYPDSDVFRQAVSIRNYYDALRVRELIENKDSCLVYGLGIEGIETAAQLHEAGLKVVIAGRGDGILKRYFSAQITSQIEKLLHEKDIPVIYNTPVQSVMFSNSEKKVCVKGKNSSFDFLLFSTGIKPEITLAKACGIECDKGIIVNPKMETSEPDVYSAGDCTQIDAGVITDHWHAAQDQGRTAAANMAGHQQVGCSPMPPKAGVAAEWPSKKYRVKVEIFGKYFFSMKPPVKKDLENLVTEESTLSNGAYRLFYYENNILKGLEMTGDKPRAKMYEKAVNEEWDRSRVRENLS